MGLAMQYTVTVQDRSRGRAVIMDTIGPFFYEAGAVTVARAESRKFTSSTVVVVVESDQRKTGFPKAFRMGRPVKA